VLLLEEKMESTGETYLRHDGYYMKLNYLQEVSFVNNLRKQVQRAMMADLNLVLLTSRNDLRFSLAKLVHKHGIPISVMLQSELVQGVMVESFGQLQDEQSVG
jgi:flagellar biosynthesis component FlhA